MEPVPSTTIKTYPRRGPLQQFRFADRTAFRCFRCGVTKKSKLITVYAGDWSKRLCNGCYGRLLSLHEIKAGTSSDDQRAEEWRLPDGRDVIEISIKAKPAEAAAAQAALEGFLAELGIAPETRQQTKTRTALEYYTAIRDVKH